MAGIVFAQQGYLVLLAPAVLALALVYVVGQRAATRRRLPAATGGTALLLRIVAVAALAVVLAAPERIGPVERNVIAFVTPEALPAMDAELSHVEALRKRISIVSGDQPDGIAAFLRDVRAALAAPDKPERVIVHVPETLASRALPLLEAAGVPWELRVSEPAASGDKRPPFAPLSGRPLLLLEAPPAVVPHEPFNASVRVENARPDALPRLALNGRDVELVALGGGRWRSGPLTLPVDEGAPPGAIATIEASLVDKDHAAPLARAWRSIAMSAPERVLVAGKPELADTVQALLPRFDVLGVKPDAPAEHWPLGTARAVLLPLDGEPPSGATLARLEAWAADGGCLLLTGLARKELRARAPRGRIASWLPVDFEAPPDEPPPEGPKIKPELGESEIAKVSVAFVIDHSGSMTQNFRWSHCKRAVNSALEQIDNFDRLGVMLFTDTQGWIDGGIADVNAGRRDFVRNYLDFNAPRNTSMTDIYGAVEAALEAQIAERAAVRLIIVVSDGDERFDRSPVLDHPRLRQRALEHDVTITTIRVGAAQEAADGARGARVMSALSTGDGMYFAVNDDDARATIPKLMVSSVEFAYRKFSEGEARRRDKPPEKPPEEPEKPLEGFVHGTLPCELTARGLALLGEQAPPMLGGGIARARVRAGAETLVSLRDGERIASALALRPMLLGHIAYFAAPLDAVNAGGWLEDPKAAAALFDRLLRVAGRPRAPELTPLLSLNIESRWASAALSAHDESGSNHYALVGVTEAEGPQAKRGELPLEMRRDGGRIWAHLPHGLESVEVRDAEGTPLARASVPLWHDSQGSPASQNGEIVRLAGTASSYDVTGAKPARRVPLTALTTALLALVLALAPVERFMRRT